MTAPTNDELAKRLLDIADLLHKADDHAGFSNLRLAASRLASHPQVPREAIPREPTEAMIESTVNCLGSPSDKKLARALAQAIWMQMWDAWEPRQGEC